MVMSGFIACKTISMELQVQSKKPECHCHRQEISFEETLAERMFSEVNSISPLLLFFLPFFYPKLRKREKRKEISPNILTLQFYKSKYILRSTRKKIQIKKLSG